MGVDWRLNGLRFLREGFYDCFDDFGFVCWSWVVRKVCNFFLFLMF